MSNHERRRRWRLVGGKEGLGVRRLVCWCPSTCVITKQGTIAGRLTLCMLADLLSMPVNNDNSLSYTLSWFNSRTFRSLCKPSFWHSCWMPPCFSPPRSPSSYQKFFIRRPKGNACSQTYLWQGEKCFTDNRPRIAPHHTAQRAHKPHEKTCHEVWIPPEACHTVISFQEEAWSQLAECIATS